MEQIARMPDTKSEAVAARIETAQKNLLIVDPDESCRMLLSTLLKEEGYRVLTGSSCTEAMDLVNSQTFNFIILDHCEPGLNGLYLLEQIKRKNHRIPILVVSSRYEVESYLIAMNLGAVDYLTKPLDYGDLRRLILTYSLDRP